MADNNKNNKNNKNSNRLRGVLTLVLWAVVLTVAMNYICLLYTSPSPRDCS